MPYDSRKLSILVGQAAHHLHATIGRIATALIDIQGNGRMLFSNSMLSFVNGATLASISKDVATKHNQGYPHLHRHALEDSELVLYLVVLDERHVFVTVASEQVEPEVDVFFERLKALLFTQVQ